MLTPIRRSYIYTGGQDAIVRVWDAKKGKEHEPDVALDAMKPITSLAASVSLSILEGLFDPFHDYFDYRELHGFQGAKMPKYASTRRVHQSSRG